MKEQVIRHTGILESIEGEHVRVRILQASACSGCAARELCSSAEAKEKVVDVVLGAEEAALAADGRLAAPALRVGQEVTLEGRLADGRAAALIAYGLPLALLIPAMLIGTWLMDDERWGAAWALLSVAIYYAFVALFLRRRLQQRFAFTLTALSESSG